MPYTADNIEITIATGTAVLATDYGTSGASGFSAAHAQIAKIAWGDVDNTYRTSDTTPLPIKIYGITGTTVPISGTVSGTGDFYVKTYPSVPLIVKGSTFSTDAPIGISGGIYGVSGGRAVGVTGHVNILNQVAIYGISGATSISVTGGRQLNFLNDSVRVYGNVGISGGILLTAASDSISVFGPGGSSYINANIYSNGTAVGVSGDALKVAVTNAGFTFSVSVAATVGVTNDSANNGLRIQGLCGGTPVVVKGQLAGGALEIGAYTPVPVGISGSVQIDDTDLIAQIETLKTNIDAVGSNARYALDILNLINSAGSGAKVIVSSIARPTRVGHGQKTITTTAALISTESLKTGVTLKSPATNSVDIYIGNSISVSSTTGYILSPGETIYIEVSGMGTLFARTPSGTATLTYIGT